MKYYYQARPGWRPRRHVAIETAKVLGLTAFVLGMFGLVLYGVPVLAVWLDLPLR